MKDQDWRKKKRSAEGSIKTIKNNLYARIQLLDDITEKRKEKLRPAKNRTHARELIKEMIAELNVTVRKLYNPRFETHRNNSFNTSRCSTYGRNEDNRAYTDKNLFTVS